MTLTKFQKIKASASSVGHLIVDPIGHGTMRVVNVVDDTVRENYHTALDKTAIKAWRKGNSKDCPLCNEDGVDMCVFHDAKFELDLYEIRSTFLEGYQLPIEERTANFANAENWLIEVMAFDVAKATEEKLIAERSIVSSLNKLLPPELVSAIFDPEG